jgi:NitT/TauT family transport system substrate-binding protein
MAIKLSQRFIALVLGVLLWVVACSPSTTTSPSAISSEPLRIGSGIWAGNAGDYVALEKHFFQEAGIKVNDIIFANYSASMPAFLSNQVDLLWVAGADAIEMVAKDPSIRVIFLTGYSDGADGILGRNINSPKDLKGKRIARENLLSANVILTTYLQQGELTEQDVNVLDMSGQDAAAAFIAGHVDAAITYGSSLAEATQQGTGKVIFTTKGTNLLSDVLAVRQELMNSRRSELEAYLRAIDRGVKLVNAGNTEALKIVAEKLEMSLPEAKQQLSWIKLFDIEGNKTIGFNQAHPNSLIKNLKFTAEIAYNQNIISKQLDINSLYDDSIVNSL